MSRRIEFFYDVASPYSYLAAILVAKSPLLKEAEWKPFLIGGVFKAAGNQMPASVPAKGQYMLKDLQRLFAYHQTPYQFPSVFPINSLQPMRALVAAKPDQIKELSLKLFDLYWGKGLNVSDPAVLAEHLPADIMAAISDDAVKEKLKANTESAAQRGAFGAPSIFVDDELYFGEDRIFLIEHLLKNDA
jgi:2-hydroxychromene-2-carboxylate isomerase